VSLDGVDRTNFEQLDPLRKFYISFLIGRGRSLRMLRSTWTPISASEVKSAIDRYREFTATVDRARIARYPITYLLTSPEEGIDFTNLDKWYERDTGETFKEFTLHRVRMRP
jgi:hypothetical protein